MKITFQADADFNQTIVSALQRREPAIDFQTADEAQLRGLPDPDVLARAARSYTASGLLLGVERRMRT